MTRNMLYFPPFFSASFYRKKDEKHITAEEKNTENTSENTEENFTFTEEKTVFATEERCSPQRKNTKFPLLLLLALICTQNKEP